MLGEPPNFESFSYKQVTFSLEWAIFGTCLILGQPSDDELQNVGILP